MQLEAGEGQGLRGFQCPWNSTSSPGNTSFPMHPSLPPPHSNPMDCHPDEPVLQIGYSLSLSDLSLCVFRNIGARREYLIHLVYHIVCLCGPQ